MKYTARCVILKISFKNGGATVIGEPYKMAFILERMAIWEPPDDAQQYLMRAYMSQGEEIFDGQDGKYLDAIKDLI